MVHSRCPILSRSSTGKCADCSQPFSSAVPKRDQGAIEGALLRRHARVSRRQHAAVLMAAKEAVADTDT
eukprot:scaffold47163_cov91-Phaeocystis_antarctica.AAC.5